MIDSLFAFIHGQPVLVFFLVLSLGYLLDLIEAARLAGLLQLRFGWVERSDTCTSASGPQIADDIAEVRFVTNYVFEF